MRPDDEYKGTDRDVADMIKEDGGEWALTSTSDLLVAANLKITELEAHIRGLEDTIEDLGYELLQEGERE